MPRLQLTTDQIVAHITAHYEGRTDVTTADVRAFCEYADLSFGTVNARLKNYRSGRGRFNLDVAAAAQQLEQTFNLPQADAVPSVTHTVCH